MTQVGKSLFIFSTDRFANGDVVEIVVHDLDEFELFEIGQIQKSVKYDRGVVSHAADYNLITAKA